MTKNKIRTISLFLLFILLNLCRNFLWLIPSVLMTPIMEELSINIAQAGYLVLVVTVLMGVFLFCGNYVLARFSPVWAMVVGLLCLSVDGICSCVSSGYGLVIVGKIFSGIGYGLTSCASTALIASNFSKEKLGIANGVLTCITMLSITCAYQWILPLSEVAGSWKKEAILLAAGGGIVAVGFWLWQYLSDMQIVFRKQNGKKADTIKLAVSYAFIRVCILIMGCLMLIYVCFNSYYPNYLHTVQGFDLQKASKIAGYVSVFGMCGSLLIGFLVHQLKRTRLTSAILLLMIVLGFCGMLIFRSVALLMLSVCCFGGCYTALAAFFSTNIMRIPGIQPLVASAGVSVMLGCGSLLALFVPYIQQALTDHFGMQTAFLLFGVIFIPAIVGLKRLPK